MKPVAIFRHIATEGPGYFSEFLDERGILWQLIRVDEGDAVPKNAGKFSGLVFMGGPMSVNDDLPWIPPLLELIRDAVARDIPVLGHCLGGQLVSKALGSVVTRNPTREIGWGEANVSGSNEARAWFGDTQSFEAFHWHGETFSLPQGAALLLSSAHCATQAYALGKHLALQCHVEMTEQMIREWCEVGARELAANAGNPAVQSGSAMLDQMADKLPQLHAVARKLYQRWVAGLVSD